MTLQFTKHALDQIHRRGYTEDDIYFIVAHGSRVRKTGVIFCQMRANAMPDDIDANDRRRKLVMTTVLLCQCGRTVITAYRSKNFRDDVRKSKYRSHRPICTCDHCSDRLIA